MGGGDVIITARNEGHGTARAKGDGGRNDHDDIVLSKRGGRRILVENEAADMDDHREVRPGVDIIIIIIIIITDDDIV